MHVLILTDHSTHSDLNSFYCITNALFRHPAVDDIHVVSRGHSKNRAFFEGIRNAGMYGISIGSPVAFPSFAKLLDDSSLIAHSGYDLLLLRLPGYTSSQFFQRIAEDFGQTVMINNPRGLLRTRTKEFLLTLDRFIPEVRLCHRIEDIASFRSKFPIVLKPLQAFGGKGIIKIDGDSVWIESAPMTFNAFKRWYTNNSTPYLAMKYLKNVDQGDKRLVVAAGQVIACINRLPVPGTWLCNVSLGAEFVSSEPDKREMEIVEYVNPIMASEGIFLYGLDTLVDDDGQRVISEINTLSVGCIEEAQRRTGKRIADRFAEKLVRHYMRIKSRQLDTRQAASRTHR